MKKIYKCFAIALTVISSEAAVCADYFKQKDYYSRMPPVLEHSARSSDRGASVTLKLRSGVPPEDIKEIIGLIGGECKQSKVKSDTFFLKTDRPEETAETLRGHPKVQSAYVDSFVGISKLDEYGFRYDDYDFHGGKTLRPSGTQVINDDNLFQELRRKNSIDLESVRAVNLIDQWHITDMSLPLLAQRLPNLRFLNVQNTRVTKQGILNFKVNKPDVTVIFP